MKSTVTGILLFCLLSTSCAASINRVVGGSDAPDGKYPYQAYVKYEEDYLCGAAIVNERHLVTSAQCINGMRPRSASIIVGTNNPKSGNGQTYSVHSFLIHEDYELRYGYIYTSVNDIALIHLRQDIEFNEKVQPIKLPKSDYAIDDYSKVNFTGLGLLGYRGNKTEILQEIELEILNHEICKAVWKPTQWAAVENSMICTIGRKKRGACDGDAGGPLVKDGVLVGISSYNWYCNATIPAVFTRVTSFVDWINGYLD